MLLCTILLCHPAAVQARGRPRQPPGQTALCQAAIAAAQRGDAAIPPDLLEAIGMVESGRRDPASGAWAPWPWTIDAAGQPAFFDSKAEAIAAVRALQARGVLSIDVGCMQINLLQHPLAFATLDAAFDPAANAAYAARFLGSLFARTGAWPMAAALYHSATPTLGAAYQRRVMAAWPEGRRLLLPITGTPPLVRAWAATLPDGSGFSVFLQARPRRLPPHRDTPARLADLAR